MPDDPFAPVPNYRPQNVPGKFIKRFWRHKETKNEVEIRRYMLVDGKQFIIVVWDPGIQRQFTMPETEFLTEYEIAPGYYVKPVHRAGPPAGLTPKSEPNVQ